jgi:hypothetical protein
MPILDGLICCVAKQTHQMEQNTKIKFCNKLSTDGKFLGAKALCTLHNVILCNFLDGTAHFLVCL